MAKLLPILVLLLAGCACEKEIQVRVIDTSCDTVKPIIISRQDILTDGTAQQLVAHNTWGRDHCGWVPPSKGKKQ